MTTIAKRVAVMGVPALLALGAMVVASKAAASSLFWSSTPNECAMGVGEGWIRGCDVGQDGGVGVSNAYQDMGGAWLPKGGGGGFITSDIHDVAWIIGGDGQIEQWNATANGFQQVTQSLSPFSSIAVGDPTRPHEIWATGIDDSIWSYSGTSASYGNGTWIQLPGRATKIAVFQDTETCGGQTIHVPWVINRANQVFEYVVSGTSSCTGGSFVQQAGAARDIATEVVLGMDSNVYQWTGTHGFAQYIAGFPGITAIGGHPGDLWGMGAPGQGNNVFTVTSVQ